jgi:hypothetical protein
VQKCKTARLSSDRFGETPHGHFAKNLTAAASIRGPRLRGYFFFAFLAFFLAMESIPLVCVVNAAEEPEISLPCLEHCISDFLSQPENRKNAYFSVA